MSTLPAETTSLFREVRRIVRWVAAGALTLCAVVALIYAVSRGDWLGGVLAGITLAMGVLPEEFPVVLTVFLAMGAWRISRGGVLTRRMPAIELIGAATVLAVDKTGTLTENRMQVVLLDPVNGDVCDLRHPGAVLTDSAVTVLDSALAASERNPFDPMERAIHEAAKLRAPASVARLKPMDLVREYDLTPELLAVTHVWRSESKQIEIAVKGAPETVVRSVSARCALPCSSAEAGCRSRSGWPARACRGAGIRGAVDRPAGIAARFSAAAARPHLPR